ncbi:MAG: error-prone DNA polymerase [Myxococcota bacterium]
MSAAADRPWGVICRRSASSMVASAGQVWASAVARERAIKGASGRLAYRGFRALSPPVDRSEPPLNWTCVHTERMFCAVAYAELMSRSCFSLLDGASQPAELVDAAARQGVAHLGLADRDSVYGVVQAHKAARETGVHLLCGATVTVIGRPAVVLYAETLAGWRSLCRLLTAARADEPKGTARIDAARVAEHAAGLSCILRPGWTAEQADVLKEAFGERLSVALCRNLTPADRVRVRRALETSRGLSAPCVASNDVRFHRPGRRPVADVLTCIRRRTTLDSAGTALHNNQMRHVLSERDFRRLYADWPEAIEAAVAVAERCTFTLDELRYTYPREVVPEGHTAMSWLTALTNEGLEQRYPDGVPEDVLQQIAYELEVIEEMEFPAYFLTVNDAVRFARSRGILCQGRGSAANSAVCYALGITAVDPSRSTLLFERFISKERGEPPDIDVDFEHERREEVIQYIYAKYGRHRAALVNEFICYRPRSAVRDIGKVFGLSLDQVDRLAKSMDWWTPGMTADVIRESGLDPESLALRQTVAIAQQMKGFPRHVSIHVGGFVIADGQLIDLVPVEPATMEGRTVIQWDKYDVDALRFVKVDILGLGMLTCIRKAFELVQRFCGQVWSLATVPAEDPAVYDMFCRADTVGVFQIESRAQMSMLPRLKPRTFYDLVVEVAIVRPGPIQGGMVHPYLRRRTGEEPVTYPHPLLEPILERTLGVPLFQEQVMAMAAAVGGFSAGEADQLRRAMGAWRKRGNLDELGRRLVAGMVEQGIEPDYAEKIYAQILGFGEYGFPESHSASFAMLVYVSGWLKCHQPAAFAAALINSQPMGFYSARAIVADAQRHGIEVRPVCALESDYDCTLEARSDGEPALRLGLRLVQGFGEEHGAAVEAARADGPFASLPDFARRTALDRGRLQALAEANAFRALGPDRRQAAWVLQGLWTELPLLAGLSRNEPAPRLPESGRVDHLKADYRTVGLSVDLHPMALARPLLPEGVVSLGALADTPSDTRVRVAGLVSSRQRPGTASGVVFMTLEDESAMTNLVVWPKIWERYRRLARHASLLGCDGMLQRQGDAISVVVLHFWECPWPDDRAAPAIRARNFH